MQAQRYSMRSVYWHIKVFVLLDRWLRQQSLGLEALNEEKLDAFMVARCGLARTANGARTVVDRLLERLRADGIAPAPKPAPTTPATELLGDYRRYLLNECGFGNDTVDRYPR